MDFSASIRPLLGHWEVALLIATWTAIGVVAIKRRHEWRRRRFVQQVNFSLNTLVAKDGAQALLLRTLLEENATNVWLNEYGVRKVIRAAKATSLEDPFLQISDSRDREIVMIAVLNVLSERFSDAFIAQAVGQPIATERFVCGLTWERYDEMKTQKLRVMVIKRADLESTFKSDASSRDLRVLEASHQPRIRTLRRMFDLWASEHEANRDGIREVELGIAIPASPPAL